MRAGQISERQCLGRLLRHRHHTSQLFRPSHLFAYRTTSNSISLNFSRSNTYLKPARAACEDWATEVSREIPQLSHCRRRRRNAEGPLQGTSESN
jgi:hypothetical protein